MQVFELIVVPPMQVKPYIPSYDAPVCQSVGMQFSDGDVACPDCGKSCVRCPKWATPNVGTALGVEFSGDAMEALSDMRAQGLALRALRGWGDVVDTVIQVVQADPRSTYRKDKCANEVYAFYLDNLDVTVEVVFAHMR